MGKTSIKMKVFQIFLLTAMVAVAMEKCVAEYLLVEIEDGPKPMPKPKPEPEPEPMPKKEISPSAKCCAERGVPQNAVMHVITFQTWLQEALDCAQATQL